MGRLSARSLLLLLIVVPTYIGPYVYMYGKTYAYVFPTVDSLDQGAMDHLVVQLDNSVHGIPLTQSVTVIVDGKPITWTVASYTLGFSINNRIFKTYIHFPALLGVSSIAFSATGVFNGQVIFTCNHFSDKLLQPTGFEALLTFGSILKAGNNTNTVSLCFGPGSPTVDWSRISQTYPGGAPITLDWQISAVLSGERLTTPRTWGGAQNVTLILP